MFKEKCIYVVIILFLMVCGLVWFAYDCKEKTNNLVEEVEYYDSLHRYNKIYYSKAFSALKKENKQLYDSLKQYKDKIDFILEFTHESLHNTGVVTTKPVIKDSVVHDTVPLVVPQIARTYEYKGEQTDTFQYKLNVNSYTEPLWYSLDVKVKNKFTIVNKEVDGTNHLVIDPHGNGTVDDVTVFHKDKKKTVWDRISVGPSVTAGYDVINKQWGIMAGASVTFDLTK